MTSRTLKQLSLVALAATLTTASPSNGWWTTTQGQDWSSSNGDSSINNNVWGPGSSSNPYNPNSPSNSFNPSNFAESTIGMAPATASRMIEIHGILASIAFVALFPIGSVVIRVVPSRHAWIVHAVTQVVAYMLYIAAAAIGIWLVSTLHFPVGFGSGSDVEDVTLFSISAINYHFIIGMVVLIVLFFQPLTGFVHHIKHKHAARDAAAASSSSSSSSSSSTTYNNIHKDHSISPQRTKPAPAPYIKRTAWSHIHLWLGRLTITLGMINGGLGLGIAGASENLIIAYSVIAGVMWLIWVASMVYGEIKRSKARKADRKRPRDMRVMPGAYTGGEVYSTYRAPRGANNVRDGRGRGNVGGGGGGEGGGGEGGGGAYPPVFESNPDAVASNDDAETTGQQRFRDEQRSRHQGASGFPEARRSEQQHAGDRAPFYRTPPVPPADDGVRDPEPASPELPIQAPQPRRDVEQEGEQPSVNRNDTVSPLSIYAVRY